MPDWICRLCNNVVRERIHAPSYCPRCGVGNFAIATGRSAPRSHSESYGSNSSLSPALEVQRFTVIPNVAPQPRRDRRRAKRVKPKTQLHVHICQVALLGVLDVSSVGLLVEHTFPFKPCERCEVELRRFGKTIRLSGEIVRSFAVRSEGNSGDLRYRTALQFFDTPQEIFGLLPELVEES